MIAIRFRVDALASGLLSAMEHEHERAAGAWHAEWQQLSDALGSPRGRLKNFVCEGHVDLRPRGPLVFGIEFRRLETTYPSGKFTANHFNLAAGYRF